MEVERIDVSFDFTTDTPSYWDNFWQNDDVLGGGNNDPDALSKTLQKHHQRLWSKQLPNGEFMDLQIGAANDYLTWKDFRFGSDSILASFRYKRYRNMLKQVKHAMPNYQTYIEDFIRKSYTIGGTIIFPKRKGGINPSRGCNAQIKDRWGLTLECIRRFYNHENSPLYDVLKLDEDFFNLFIDFKGYVDYFYLQDCVSPDYCSVLFWLGDGTFSFNPLPKNPDEYNQWIKKNLEFVEKRNARIRAAFDE